MSDLEVRQLRYFVAVAEELHFGRAAERLGMAQPPLSRAIRTLERQLGVRLLERTTRQVALTPAGQVLLRDARGVLDAVAAAARRASHAGRPEPGLRLAMKADYDGGLLPQILAAYRQEAAALPVELLLGGRDEQAPALREGRADVALLPAPADARGLDVEPLLTEPRLVALAADDPLAARPSLRLADLAGRTLPDGTPADAEVLPPWSGPAPVPAPAPVLAPVPARATAAAPLPAAAGLGGVPSTRLDLAQIFNLVELGLTVMFPPVSLARRHPRPGIAYRTVSDLAPVTLVLAWPQECRSPAVAAFVAAATAVAAEAGAVEVSGPAATASPAVASTASA